MPDLRTIETKALWITPDGYELRSRGDRHAWIDAYLERLMPAFSEAERACILDNVHNIICVENDDGRLMDGAAGCWVPKTKEVYVDVDSSQRPQQEGIDPICFTLAHELCHPIGRKAATVGPGGFLIINPDRRAQAQEKIRELFPSTVAQAEAWLQDRGPAYPPIPRGATPQETVAIMAYLYLDERYYDRCGGTIAMVRAGSRGYTAPNRNHEVMCNLRALQICEKDLMRDQPGEAVLSQIAGPIFEHVNEQFAKALEREATQANHQKLYGIQPRADSRPQPSGFG